MNKKTDKNTNKKQNRSPSYLFDGIAALVLIAFALVETLLFKRIFTNYGQEIREPSAAIIITLIPCVITIVSITLSMSREKIYGATLNDINGLRGRFYFTFLHAMLIACGIIGAYSLCYAFDLRITIYYLESISLVYSIIFSLQSIPVLARSKWILKKILKKNYLTTSRHSYLFEKENTKTFRVLITNIIFTEGIDTAFNLLYKKDKKDEKNEKSKQELLDYLLTMQNKYYWHVIDSLSLEKTSLSDKYYDVSIIDAIDAGYDNITMFISNYSEDNSEIELEKKKYYQITRLLFSLHELCHSLTLQKKEKERLIPMIAYSPIFLSGQKNSFGISPIVCMLATTLNEGETWFAKYLRDNNYCPDAIFDYKACPIGAFVCMMIEHLLRKKVLGENQEKEIMDLIKEPTQGLNADGSSWTKLMKYSIEYRKKWAIVSSISLFLNYFDSVDESVFYFHGSRKCIAYDASEDFTKQNIFHDWLLLVFSSMYIDSSPINLENALDKLSDDDKKTLAEELSENWLEQGKIKENIDMAFLTRFEIDVPNSFLTNQVNDKIIEKLVKFHDIYYQKRYEELASTETSLGESKKMIIEKAQKAMEGNVFYDSKLPIENEPEMCFEFEIRAHKYQRLLESYLEQLPESFMRMINDSLVKKVGKASHDERTITDDIIKQIIKFKPNFSSSYYLLCSYLMDDDKYKEQIEKLNIQNVFGLYPGLYWKDGAIRFNAKVNKDLTLIRPLRDNELDEIIENEYEPFDNGLYRYSEFKNDKKRDFYVTKDQLIGYLKESIFYVAIVFKSSIKIDESKIKTFSHKAVNK